MTSSEVAELIAALKDGTTTLDQVARRFRERRWPHTKPPRATSYLDLAARAEQDPDPYVPGSFDDVAAAFHRGDITREQYRVLAEAAAESMRAEESADS
jgi:hypothetical protein